MKRLLEIIELTDNSQEETQAIWTDVSSHGHDLLREPVAIGWTIVDTPLPAPVWHCSEYDF